MKPEKYWIIRYPQRNPRTMEQEHVVATDARSAIENSQWGGEEPVDVLHHYYLFGARADSCLMEYADGTIVKAFLSGWFEAGRLRSGDQGGRSYFIYNAETSDETDPDSGLKIVHIDIPVKDLKEEQDAETGCGCEWGRGIECVLDLLLREGVIASWEYKLIDNNSKARWSVSYDFQRRDKSDTSELPSRDQRRYEPYEAKIRHFKLDSRDTEGFDLDIPNKDLNTGGKGPDCNWCNWGSGVECALDEMEFAGIIADWGAGWKIILGYERGFYYVNRKCRQMHGDNFSARTYDPASKFAIRL